MDQTEKRMQRNQDSLLAPIARIKDVEQYLKQNKNVDVEFS